MLILLGIISALVGCKSTQKVVTRQTYISDHQSHWDSIFNARISATFEQFQKVQKEQRETSKVETNHIRDSTSTTVDKKGIIKSSNENAFRAILELQIQTYILTTEALSEMKRTEVVIANKVEGKRLGRPSGPSRETPRAKRIKARIIKDSVDFEGSTPVGELISSLSISRQTYYNYKKQILEKEGDDNENI